MSSSDSPDKTRLSIRAGVPDAQTTVFDAWDRVVHEHLGAQTVVELPKGLYTIRVERGGLLEETLVRHAAPRQVEPQVPGRYTSALIAGATTSHEYFTEPAVRYSTEMTAPDQGGGDDSGLFLFVRTSNDRFSEEIDVSEGLSLVTPGGEPIDLSGDLARRDTDRGWMAFSAKALPGTCHLRYAGESPRIVPIHLSRGWQTQVFLTHRGRPLFEGMRVFQADRHGGFRPNDETSEAVDRALNDLQFGTRSISRDEMNHLLGGKFANPMLGLLAAHLLLRREEPNLNLLQTVIYNLHHLAGDSPDFAALCLRINRRFPDEGRAPPAPPTFPEPPMIRDGFEAVVAASADDLELIPPWSPMAQAVTGLYHDSPWTSFKFEEPTVPQATTGFLGRGPLMDSGSIASLELPPFPGEPEFDWVETAILDHLESQAAAELTVEPALLARAIGVSQGAVLTALAALRSRSPEAIESEWPRLAEVFGMRPDLMDEGLLEAEGESMG